MNATRTRTSPVIDSQVILVYSFGCIKYAATKRESVDISSIANSIPLNCFSTNCFSTITVKNILLKSAKYFDNNSLYLFIILVYHLCWFCQDL